VPHEKKKKKDWKFDHKELARQKREEKNISSTEK
jgi:hypothetical protein